MAAKKKRAEKPNAKARIERAALALFVEKGVDAATTREIAAAADARHAAAVAGLDQEMPSGDFFGDALKAAVVAGHVDEAVVDDKVSD